MRSLLLGDIERDHRQGGASAGQLAGFDPGQQPAQAELGHLDRVTHLGSPALAQRLLQAIKFVKRIGLDLITADRLQAGRQPGSGRGITGDAQGRAGARRPALQPAARGFVSGQADAGGIHQRTDLQLGQIVLVLQAAVLYHRHHAQRTGFAQEGAQPGAQALAPSRRLGHCGPHFQCPLAGLQVGMRPLALPGQQLAQIGRCFGQHHRRPPQQGLECGVAAHHQAAAVVDQHADRAEVEPLVDLVAALTCLQPRLVLGGGVMQQRQQQRSTVVCADPTRHRAKPALAALLVDQPALDLAFGLLASGQGRLPELARLVDTRMVFGRHIVDRIAPQQQFGRSPGRLAKGAVGGDNHEIGVLHQQRLRRVPEQAHQVAGGASGQQWHGRCRRGQVGTQGPGIARAARQLKVQLLPLRRPVYQRQAEPSGGLAGAQRLMQGMA